MCMSRKVDTPAADVPLPEETTKAATVEGDETKRKRQKEGGRSSLIIPTTASSNTGLNIPQ